VARDNGERLFNGTTLKTEGFYCWTLVKSERQSCLFECGRKKTKFSVVEKWFNCTKTIGARLRNVYSLDEQQTYMHIQRVRR
jgi:hypothetical protein